MRRNLGLCVAASLVLLAAGCEHTDSQKIIIEKREETRFLICVQESGCTTWHVATREQFDKAQVGGAFEDPDAEPCRTSKSKD